ncbi:MAG: hypothetical protein UY23_C0003G0016 [Candidatus Jorgensenbacteria bacterium GW2011_GWA1_48_11]|uniref:Baseplate protein J-like domain-containing protein n=1 Tax=Candidatus Jorgensenbacteria bacterium GW2011_GWA1_48_11 TaxID=1618660 RepID=A0A0G1WLH6_9BACT|nr:MAG: hypothetical protein UY23_C0003G0016 [Candidatus Jorgensenbacteria bacterium GW2011_GWA1_48_11]KKW11854.1 MAG: hypothetical protein UY51_C0005G0095 [Candidatus Jorgensenbacteria bacterium GW2011_GWB1_49_9]
MAKTENKIFLDRTDNLTTIVDKLIKASAERIVLNIPKNSLIGESLHNFQVLKREGVTAGKELLIESVDDHILELAGICGLTATNPVFKTRERAFTDIVPRGSFKRQMSDIRPASEKEPVPAPPPKTGFFKKEKAAEEKKPITIPKKESPPFKGEIREEFSRPKKEKKPRPLSRRIVFILSLIVLTLAAYELAVNILPRAAIAITLKKNPVNFSETVKIDVSLKQPAIGASGGISLPGELLVANRNLTMSFPASGKAQVETKATGLLFVYNAFSSASQNLVATTRFQTPDGKIFRLVNPVTIPGAKVVNGEITPSKISVSVAADQAGADYNIPPTAGWKIPGFQSDPLKYQKFYAESLAPMTGGFIGEKAVPSPGDILNATTSIEQSLANVLQSQMGVLMASQFKLFDNAKKFTVLEEKIQNSDDSSNEFSVYASAEMRELVFDEEMLKKAITDKAAAGLPPGLRVADFSLDYATATADLANGKLSFSVRGDIVFVADFNADQFRSEIAGKDETSLRNMVFALPGLERATISLWPFWVQNVPRSAGKVEITVN